MIFQKLKEQDREVFSLIQNEERRQKEGIHLIASENFASVAVLEANASVFTNKYSEGYPGQRYYGGNENTDQIEVLCQKRALELFDLDPNVWGVNVQAYSGSPANFAVYTALVGPGGRIMGLDLPCGGHLTHGYQSKTRKVSATSLFFESKSYKTGENDLIDFVDLETKALDFKPQILICGFSAYPRDIDYLQFRRIADLNDSFLLADISHINGFVATKLMNNPFNCADVVTTTTHKLLRGPRGALIFYRKSKILKDKLINIEQLINAAVFPGLQGGPHNNTICAIAVALNQAKSVEYAEYCKKVLENAKLLAEELMSRGYKIVTNGTDSHIILVDLSPLNISGSVVERICELLGIYINKNCTPSSKTPFNPKGVRLGTCAMTTRGLNTNDFKTVAEFLDSAIKLVVTSAINFDSKDNNIMDLVALVSEKVDFVNLKRNVLEFARKFPIPQVALTPHNKN